MTRLEPAAEGTICAENMVRHANNFNCGEFSCSRCCSGVQEAGACRRETHPPPRTGSGASGRPGQSAAALVEQEFNIDNDCVTIHRKN